jgi:hypothetical protein
MMDALPMKRLLTPMIAVLLCVNSCFFDADIPLRNDPPACENISNVKKTLFHPDSSVCTLLISDRNDQSLSVAALDCSTSSDRPFCDSQKTVSWPGEYRFLSTGYGIKQIHLLLDTNRMGVYRGILLLEDEQHAVIKIPYAITKQFVDRFDTYPLSSSLWQPYRENDSINLRYDYIDHKLNFTFKQSSENLTSPRTTGIHSRFSITSSFYTSVKFKLRDEMDDAFETAFFISSSPDTNLWSGERAGIFISGVGNRLIFECRSTDLQNFHFETTISSGEIAISRSDTLVHFFFYDGNPSASPQALATETYPAEKPVYIHMKMTVSDLAKDRNCYWNDFLVSEGVINIPAL